MKFSTYAVPIILGEIKRFFRDDGAMRISRSVKESYLQMLKVQEQLQQKLGRKVSYEEIAEACELDVADVILAFEANQFTLSFDEVIYENDGSQIIAVMQQQLFPLRQSGDLLAQGDLQGHIA